MSTSTAQQARSTGRSRDRRVRASSRGLALALLAPFFATSCELVPHAEARIAYASLDLGGEIGLGGADGSAPSEPRLDLQDDLGIDDAVGAPYATGELQTLAGNVSLTAFVYSETSQGVLSGDFGDIAGGQAVETDFDLTNLKAFYSYDLLDVGPVRLAPGIGLDVIDTQTTVVTQSAPSAFEELDVFAPVPMLFVEAEVDLELVSAEVEVGGSTLSFGDGDGTFWDVEAQIVVSPMPFLDLHAGYRLISIDADGRSDGQAFDADLDVQGWFVGGGVRF